MRHLIVLPVLLLATIFFAGCSSSSSCGSCSNSHYEHNQAPPGTVQQQPNSVSSDLTQPEPIAAPVEDVETTYTENLQPAVLPPAEPPMPSPETEVPPKTPVSIVSPPKAPTNLIPPANDLPTAPPANQLPTVLESI